MTSFRSGFVGLLGPTNVGKSTFLNAVMGEDLLITSAKPQTTRNRIRCVYTTDAEQIVFVDTPGLHRARNRLGRHLLREAFRALRGLDVILYMIEPTGRVTPDDEALLPQLNQTGCPVILLVNKLDRARGAALEETLLSYEATGAFAELVPISALTGRNLDEALRTIVAYLPIGKPLFPEDVRFDHSEAFLIGELIREQIVLETSQELPYVTAVAVRSLHEREDGLLEIKAEIIAEKSSHKGILLGKGGERIKRIGSQARTRIEALLGVHAYLELTVKIRKGWTRSEKEIARLTEEAP